MAGELSSLTELTSGNLHDNDLLEVVDVSDTSMAAAGTNKKTLWSSIKATLKTHFDTLYDAAGAAAAVSSSLGNSASRNVGSTTGTVAAGDDSRLSDARTPTSHASSHLTGGADAIQLATASQPGLATPAQITKLDAITGTNTGDNAVNSLYSGLVSNATHTGDVTGATALTIANDAVTLAKMSAGTAGNLITYDASGNPAAVATGTAGQVLTSNGAGAPPTMQTPSGGGSLTNFTEAVNTSAPNATVPVVSLTAANAATDVDIAIKAKGTGALLAQIPNSGTGGGNKRGTGAVDWQMMRNAATQVASGIYSFLAGAYNTASGSYSAVVGGILNVASNSYAAIVGGYSNTASGTHSFIGGGESNTTSGAYSAVNAGIGNAASNTGSFVVGGLYAVSDCYGMYAHASGRFAANGDVQNVRAVLRNKTTTNAAVELFLDGSTNRLTLASGKIMSGTINITGVKSDGSAKAHYLRQFSIINVGGTTSAVYSAVTIGTDTAAGTSISITANDTNDALKIEATGITSETWRWSACVDALQIAYGV